ncbi:MAG: signal peptide peptidase SppA [Phycisphaerales bacterium]|nr:signal peptide peptidase SppA [Phycisphaerales bacterium]
MTKRYATPTRLLLCAAVALASCAATFAQQRLLRLKLDGPVIETPKGEELFDFGELFGEKARTLHDITTAIRTAAKDSEIAGMVLFVEQPQIGLAQADEVVRAIRDFRKAGKKVYCYLDSAGNGVYAIAASADHITLSQNSSLDIIGLNAQMSFYKGLLDKLNCNMEMLHCGAYKTALEPFVRTEPSKENAEMVNWLLDGIYTRWINMIAEGRNLKPDQVRAAVDAAPIMADKALELKLIDAVGSMNDFREMVRKHHGKDCEIVKKYPEKDGMKLDFNNPFAMFQIFSKMMEEAASTSDKPGIGIVYIEGPIVDGRSEVDWMSGSSSAGSTTIRAAFEKALEDENVKAVVVRVNSPGGSALASDIMWEAATRCAKAKPLIVSMGNVAGSGGYYVSIPGDTIFAEEATLTGSIGVVGGKMVWKGLFENHLGITTFEFPRGKHAGLMSQNRPWSDEERAAMTKLLDDIYVQFKGRIMTSRGPRIKGDLEKMAGGRVYTGKQALELGLIDRIGGLSDAIVLAAEKAKLSDYEIYVYPKPKDIGDIFRQIAGEETDKGWDADSGPVLRNAPLIKAALQLIGTGEFGPARSALNGLSTAIILDRAKVGCFMPFDLQFR